MGKESRNYGIMGIVIGVVLNPIAGIVIGIIGLCVTKEEGHSRRDITLNVLAIVLSFLMASYMLSPYGNGIVW